MVENGAEPAHWQIILGHSDNPPLRCTPACALDIRVAEDDLPQCAVCAVFYHVCSAHVTQHMWLALQAGGCECRLTICRFSDGVSLRRAASE